MALLRSSLQDFGLSDGGGSGIPGSAAFARSPHLLLVVLCGLAACNRNKPPPAPAAPVAAVVEGTSIPVSAVQREIDRLRRGAGTAVIDGVDASAHVDPKDVPRLGRALLDPLVDRALLVNRAKSAGMTVSDVEVQRAIDALGERAKASGQTLAERLAQDGQTPEALAEETRDRLLAEKWVAQQTRGETPSSAEARAYFDTHRSEFDTPEQAHALQILVMTAEEAKSLLDQIRKGASFEDLAKSHGRSPDARKGGDLGWFARGTMPKVFDDACFSLKPGQVSGVVQSSYGYHLFKLLGKRPAKKRTIDEVQAEVVRRAYLEKKTRAERQLLEQVRKSGNVQINEAALSLLR
ncbi:MAG TPA: peptidylprolyl isomerase [Myxococcales bacterium]|nr:peptidylprolyl isomerase [Myxococcales bacterium]